MWLSITFHAREDIRTTARTMPADEWNFVIMTTGTPVSQLFYAESRRLGLVAAACALLTGPVACGSSASDSTPAHKTGTTAPPGAVANLPWAGQAQERRVSLEGFRFSFGDRLPQDQPAQVARESAGRMPVPVATGPSVTPEPRTGPEARVADQPVDGGAATAGAAPIESALTDTGEEDPSLQEQTAVTLDPFWTEREDVD